MGVEFLSLKDSVVSGPLLRSQAFFFFAIYAFSISCYIWIRARALIRSISSGILSFGRIIAKITLFNSFLFKVFRDFLN
jgi:hypothetical protein